MARKAIHKLFQIFEGNLVQIVTKQKQGENPIIVEGYLVDCDDINLYIGDNTGNILASVKDSEVFLIKQATDEMQDYLQNEMPDAPDNTNGYN